MPLADEPAKKSLIEPVPELLRGASGAVGAPALEHPPERSMSASAAAANLPPHQFIR